MRCMVNGRMVDTAHDADGMMDSDQLREVAGIPTDRPLIWQKSDGTNVLINPGEHVKVKPGENFMDAPKHERGRR